MKIVFLPAIAFALRLAASADGAVLFAAINSRIFLRRAPKLLLASLVGRKAEEQTSMARWMDIRSRTHNTASANICLTFSPITLRVNTKDAFHPSCAISLVDNFHFFLISLGAGISHPSPPCKDVDW